MKMDIFTRTLLFLLSALPLTVATFFPFASPLSPLSVFRPSLGPPPRYVFRPPRTQLRSPPRPQPPPPPPQTPPSTPPTDYVPVQSPIFGLRVYVPRDLVDFFKTMFNARPTLGPEPYPRPPPNPYHPPNPFYPINGGLPNAFPSNAYPSPNLPPRGLPPSINPDTFIHLMRTFYPHLISQPDPRFPNVFAVRIPPEPLPPPTHFPDGRPLTPEFSQFPFGRQQQQPQQQQQQLQSQPQSQLESQSETESTQSKPCSNGDFAPELSRLLEPPLPNFKPPYSEPLNNNRPPQNQIIIIRSR